MAISKTSIHALRTTDEIKEKNILIVGATMAPLVKAGGLADVMRSLPLALTKLNISVQSIIPHYNLIPKKIKFKKIGTFSVEFNQQNNRCTLWKLKNWDTDVYTIEHNKYFGGEEIYPTDNDPKTGLKNELVRFLFFNAAVIEVIKKLPLTPSLIHVNDWHSALIPLLSKQKNLQIPTLLTIHNLAYQGVFYARNVERLLGYSIGTGVTINFLKSGVKNADYINTVSPTYASEILTEEYGEGLEYDLADRKNNLYGIINGIDVDKYNPATDMTIQKRFKTPKVKEGKEKNKKALQKEHGLMVANDLPLFGMVTRLYSQKGLDILMRALPHVIENGMQLIVLGTGQNEYETALKTFAKNHPRNIAVDIKFDAALANKIYASSDYFLMPSKYEPCGLGQMIAMRYGTIPIVRKTGGLKDTVTDIREQNGNGIVFEEYSARALEEAIERAITLYDNRSQFVDTRENALEKDFSWEFSAKKYKELYETILTQV